MITLQDIFCIGQRGVAHFTNRHSLTPTVLGSVELVGADVRYAADPYTFKISFGDNVQFVPAVCEHRYPDHSCRANCVDEHLGNLHQGWQNGF